MEQTTIGVRRHGKGNQRDAPVPKAAHATVDPQRRWRLRLWLLVLLLGLVACLLTVWVRGVCGGRGRVGVLPHRCLGDGAAVVGLACRPNQRTAVFEQGGDR